MRFVSRIDLYLPADVLERSPTVWDKLQSLWTTVDLRTDRARSKLEAVSIVYDFRRVLDDLGVDNARSLVIDGETVFHDQRGEPGDLPNLLLALSEHTAIFGRGAQELRLSVEHEEAGLRLVIEVTTVSEHPRGAASARISVLGEVLEFEPRPGESGAEYRARVHPLVAEPSRRLALRLQFGSFISRIEAALSRHFAEARIAVTTEALDVAPVSREPPPRPEPRRSPLAPEETAAPARNFTLSVEQRVAALMSGPPAYALRLRRIEDLESELVDLLIEKRAADGPTIPIGVARKLEELNRLIGEHNLYYPVERNLPVDVRSGQLLDLGEPWTPLPAVTIDTLRAKARARGR
ncbi:MAG: hypothetical protein U1A78_40650 [Polyangia bacterium]